MTTTTPETAPSPEPAEQQKVDASPPPPPPPPTTTTTIREQNNEDTPPSSPPSNPPPPPPLSTLYHTYPISLAPMVRAGTLPLRLLSLQYGANQILVYGEEIIDRKLMRCLRVENKALGTIDFILPKKEGKKGGQAYNLVFQTVPAEKGKVIFQLGTRNPEWAVAAAKIVAGDVAGIDLNMGCPKKFSVQDGMGAALLDNPETAGSVIRALREALPHLPITCKIRLLDSSPPEKTVAFAKAMEMAGACAINVHLRTKKDEPKDPPRWECLKAVVDAVRIPVIANGDMYSYEDVEEIKWMSGCVGVMLARPVLWNPSIFRTLVPATDDERWPLLPLEEVIQDYLALCLKYESHIANAKYVVMEMMVKRRHPERIKARWALQEEEGTLKKEQHCLPEDKTVAIVSRTKTVQELAAFFGVTSSEGRGGGEGVEGLHKYDDAYFLGGGVIKRGKEDEEDKEEEEGKKRAKLS